MCGITGLFPSRQQSCVLDETVWINGQRNGVSAHGASDRSRAITEVRLGP